MQKLLIIALCLIACVARGGTEIKIGWTPPLTNIDGSPITDLAEYNVYLVTNVTMVSNSTAGAISSNTPVRVEGGVILLPDPLGGRNALTHGQIPAGGTGPAAVFDYESLQVRTVVAENSSPTYEDHVEVTLEVPAEVFWLSATGVDAYGNESDFCRPIYTDSRGTPSAVRRERVLEISNSTSEVFRVIEPVP